MKKNAILVFFIFILIIGPTFARKDIQGEGQRWAICIGISDYKDKRIIDLKSPAEDAKKMAEILKDYGKFDNVAIMTEYAGSDSENYPQKKNVLQKLNSLKVSIKPEDMVVFFFSGHGISNAGGEGFLVLANSYRENLNGTSLKIKDVVKWLEDLKVKKSLLLVDACREKFLNGKDIKLNGVPKEDFGNKIGGVFYAANSGSFSYESSGGGIGVFTAYLTDGLKGLADSKKKGGNGDGIVDFTELGNYLSKGISQWASANGKKQVPYTWISGEMNGKPALSSYDNLPTPGISAIAAASAPSLKFRKTYGVLKGDKISLMLKKYGFFEKKSHPNQTYNGHLQSKTVSGNAVVLDNTSGLMWHQGGTEKHMEFEPAKKWLDDLNQKGYAGYKDWRIPTVEEAASLLRKEKTAGGLYVDPLFSQVQKYIWTGDNSAKEAAWVVFFDQGQINRDYYFNYFFLRPVRDAK
ncbi:MAG: DUF1566 domain-containing protein [bacterium]|nr:DUF1566 domain-containing protein [bacterium]